MTREDLVKPLVCIGMLGTTLDQGSGVGRWNRWRPSVSLFQHEDLLIDRFELMFQSRFTPLAQQVTEDIARISPRTEVRHHLVDLPNPWDFERVYAELHDFARRYPFDTDREDYLVHITTGSHVAQICSFLLTESRHMPARLLQGSPPRADTPPSGRYAEIDLDLSRYDQIFARFQEESREGVSYLKAGVETLDAGFNAMIAQIERVALASTAPLLLTGPTGAGKTQLARRIYDLKIKRRQVEGRFVEVNCATLRGDGAMSTLFGHTKGAYTGAVREREGLLRAADGGVLFLDEIGELGLDEQAMLLRALESGRFMPVGSDREASSRFQLIAGTNRALRERVAQGEFREDLLARVNLWSFELPGLAQRRADIEPNLDFELDRWSQGSGERVTMNKEARTRYLSFAMSPSSSWRGNFRDLNASVTRMATLAGGGRIGVDEVRDEVARLERDWGAASAPERRDELAALESLLGAEAYAGLDRFDRAQLAEVVSVCAESRSLSEAGRELFSESRKRKKSSNDADRLRKYLAKFDLSFDAIHGRG